MVEAGIAELRLHVDVEAAPAVTWAAMTDWDRQGEWMLATSVRGTVAAGHGVGGQLVAVTGRRPLAFRDPMVITTWEPPYRCVVRHTGRLVRGVGIFEVAELPGGRSRFIWVEQLVLPLGWLGELGFGLLRPLARVGVRYSLRRFARWAPTRGGS